MVEEEENQLLQDLVVIQVDQAVEEAVLLVQEILLQLVLHKEMMVR